MSVQGGGSTVQIGPDTRARILSGGDSDVVELQNNVDASTSIQDQVLAGTDLFPSLDDIEATGRMALITKAVITHEADDASAFFNVMLSKGSIPEQNVAAAGETTIAWYDVHRLYAFNSASAGDGTEPPAYTLSPDRLSLYLFAMDGDDELTIRVSHNTSATTSLRIHVLLYYKIAQLV